MKRIGCRPPYWQMQADIPNCTSDDQLKRLGKKYIDCLSIFLKVFGDNFSASKKKQNRRLKLFICQWVCRRKKCKAFKLNFFKK